MPFIALGVAMIIVDATIVNVAVPTIIRELHVSATTAEWFNTIYALVFASLLITLGHTGDVWGRRRLFLTGTVVFVAASLVAATAPSGSVLILGRFLQGIGGAMILPATLSTVNATFVGQDRAIAFAIWGSTIGGVAALGPLLGGWLTTDYSWRWAFLINVPIGAVVVAGIVFVVPETRDPDVRRGIDWWGNLLLIAGLATLVFGLIEGGQYGWWQQVAQFTCRASRGRRAGRHRWPWRSAVSVVSLVGFVFLERVAGSGTGRPRRPRAVRDPQLRRRERGSRGSGARGVRPALRAAPVPPRRARLQRTGHRASCSWPWRSGRSSSVGPPPSSHAGSARGAWPGSASPSRSVGIAGWACR